MVSRCNIAATGTIRPDGTDVSGRPVGALAPSTQATTRSAPTPPAPRATTATTAAPARGGGPISLDPQSGEPAVGHCDVIGGRGET